MQLKIGICSRLTCTNTLGGRASSLNWMKNEMPRREKWQQMKEKKSAKQWRQLWCHQLQRISSNIRPSFSGKDTASSSTSKSSSSQGPTLASHPGGINQRSGNATFKHTKHCISARHTPSGQHHTVRGGGKNCLVWPAHKTSPSNPSTTHAVQSFIACCPLILLNIQKRKQERSRGCFAHLKMNSSLVFVYPTIVVLEAGFALCDYISFCVGHLQSSQMSPFKFVCLP